MNDSFRTDVFVRFHPETIACACIYLAARQLQVCIMISIQSYTKFLFVFLYPHSYRRGYIAITLSVRPFTISFKDVSVATGRNDFIFDTWLWHSGLYRVSLFQTYRTSNSCLPRDLEFFMFAVMKTFVTDISASTGRNDFIFDMWLWHGDLYCVSPFQVYCTSTSCLQSVEIYTNLTQMNE
jgi:hypothetical protein